MLELLESVYTALTWFPSLAMHALLDFAHNALRLIENFANGHPTIMPLVGAGLGAGFTGFIAWISLRINAAVNIRNKRMDTILKCSDRYNALYEMRKTIEKAPEGLSFENDSSNNRFYFVDPSSHEVKTYFRIFWGLKSDQLDYWLAGYIDSETLASWVISCVENLEYVGNYDEASAGIRLRDSLKEMRKLHGTVNKNLVDLIEFCFDFVVPIQDDATRYAAVLNYLRILERNERSFIRLLARNNFQRAGVAAIAPTMWNRQREEYEALNTEFFVVKALRRLRATVRQIVKWGWMTLTLSWNDNKTQLKEKIRLHPSFTTPIEIAPEGTPVAETAPPPLLISPETLNGGDHRPIAPLRPDGP